MRQPDKAFTLSELLVVIATLALLSACLLPAWARTRSDAHRMDCADNLKQVGVAFRSWANDHNGLMPMSLSGAQGGSLAEVGTRTVSTTQSGSRGVFKVFLCLSNQLSAPRTLFCPAEYDLAYRQMATTFAGSVSAGTGGVPYTNDLNVSYFIGVDTSESMPRMLLAGDDNLGGNADPPNTAFLQAPNIGLPFVSLGTNFYSIYGPAFMNNMHGKQGNVGLGDGSVDWFGRTNLQIALKLSGDTGRPAGNFVLAPGSTAGGGCNRIQLP